MIAALGGPYASRADGKKQLSIPDSNTSRDAEVDSKLLSGADAINRWCGRQFGQVTVASEREFDWGPTGLDVDDFWTTDDLVLSGVAWDAGNPSYRLLPRNGIMDGVPGWPYTRLESIWTGHPIQPVYGGTEIIAAKWGWAAVPASVTEANLLLMADDLKSGDAPFGVAGFGDYVVRIRANPKVQEKLAPYIKHPIKVAS